MPPVITNVSGSMAHGGELTITGSGFGTKTTAAPIIWDDASGPADMTDLFTVVWPNASTITDFNLKRRAPIRGIAPPHTRVGRYAAGCHANKPGGSTAVAGFDVMAWKQMTVTAPVDVYASLWKRFDPAWDWTTGGLPNLKMFYWRQQPNIGTPGFVINYMGGLHPPAIGDPPKTIKWGIYSSTSTDTLNYLNTNGQSYPQGQFVYSGVGDAGNTIAQWMKLEILMKCSGDGFVRVYENGRQVFGYNGHVDTSPAATRTWAFGAFARPYNNPNHWRYMTDMYMDLTHARVLLGNHPALNAQCTTREIQLPLAWSDTEITIRMNRGVFSDGATPYLAVVDADNVASNFFPLQAGPPQTNPPQIISALSAEAIIGQNFEFQLVATNNPTSYGGLPPPGFSVHPTTGLMSALPAQGVPGTYLFSVSAANAHGQDIETFSLTIKPGAPSGPGPITIARSRVGGLARSRAR